MYIVIDGVDDEVVYKDFEDKIVVVVFNFKDLYV